MVVTFYGSEFHNRHAVTVKDEVLQSPATGIVIIRDELERFSSTSNKPLWQARLTINVKVTT